MPPSTDPIFVVGTPRSGTTLLAAMLGAGSHVDCGPETRFFPWLERQDLQAVLDPAGWPDRATDMVVSLTLQDSPVHRLFGLAPEQVRGFLAERPPSVAAMLESLTAQRAAANGKPRWAEKTPRHISALPRIRQAWPGAHILRVVRDPRDVALSLARVPWGSGSLAANVVLAARDERRFRAFAARDIHAHTVRFEDLVTDPAVVLRRICAIVDIPFEADMIDRRAGVEGIAAPHETWKRKAGEPLDPSRIGAWRADLPEDIARFAALHARELLRAHGYEGARDPGRIVTLVHEGDVEVPPIEPVLLALAAQDGVIEEPTDRSPAALARAAELVFWGSPEQLGLRLGRGAAARTGALARLGATLTRRCLTGQAAIWIRRPGPTTGAPARAAPRVVGRLLQRTARRGKPADLALLLGLEAALPTRRRRAPGDADDHPPPGTASGRQPSGRPDE